MKAFKCDIGIWYSVWYSYDQPEIIHTQHNTWKAWNIEYIPLLPDNTYGLYDSIDEKIIRFHLKEMSDAGIDFIIMDQTNRIDAENGYINRRALKVAKVIHDWNNEGNRPIRYCSAIGAVQWDMDGKSIESEAALLYERYLKEDFADAYYCLDGKPLLIVYGDGGEDCWNKYVAALNSTSFSDNFTIRYADNQSAAGSYGWAFDKGTKQHEEVMVVMPGWDNRKGAKPVPRNHGEWYKESWKQVFDSETKPKIIVINSFNEWAENTGMFPALTNLYGDDAPDMYWNMTKKYIKLAREGGDFN